MVKNLPEGDAEDMSSVLASGRSPGEGNGSPLQYSCQDNPMDRGAWWATVHGVAKDLDTAEYTHTHTGIIIFITLGIILTLWLC